MLKMQLSLGIADDTGGGQTTVSTCKEIPELLMGSIAALTLIIY
jgi:hypothetical protein